MIIDAKAYKGTCSCGKSHEMQTKLCIIEEDALKDLEKYVEQMGIAGKGVAVFDENTREATEGYFTAFSQVILPAVGLHADERGVALLEAALPADTDYLIAVGSGTVHDIVRYVSYRKELPFVSCPTAASVDGFCSSVAAMTWEGAKRTLTAKAPVLVVADTAILRKAPLRLSRSGFGDMIGKFVALADWKMAHILRSEYYCERIAEMTREATRAVTDAASGIAAGEAEAYERLAFGLCLSGIAMQMLGTSRPASGAEHHVSHLIETAPASLGISSDALHGEKVGVATLLVAEQYHRLSAEGFPIGDYREVEDFVSLFGKELGEKLAEENASDAARGIRAAEIAAAFPQLAEVVREIPAPETLLPLYQTVGACQTLSDIGVGEEKRELLLTLAPLVRNRLTLLRLARFSF